MRSISIEILYGDSPAILSHDTVDQFALLISHEEGMPYEGSLLIGQGRLHLDGGGPI